jgi:uncharacterized iron-regulated membrane protein
MRITGKLIGESILLSIGLQILFALIQVIGTDCMIDEAGDSCSPWGVLSTTGAWIGLLNVISLGLFSLASFALTLTILYVYRRRTIARPLDR